MAVDTEGLNSMWNVAKKRIDDISVYVRQSVFAAFNTTILRLWLFLHRICFWGNTIVQVNTSLVPLCRLSMQSITCMFSLKLPLTVKIHYSTTHVGGWGGFRRRHSWTQASSFRPPINPLTVGSSWDRGREEPVYPRGNAKQGIINMLSVSVSLFSSFFRGHEKALLYPRLSWTLRPPVQDLISNCPSLIPQASVTPYSL